jgi:conjugal transfer pilus assembly protein TraV
MTPLRGIATLATASLCACASMSGLDGHSHYACQAPEGVACQSVSGTYANAAAGSTAPRRPASAPVPLAPVPVPERGSASTLPAAPTDIPSGDPTRALRSTPRVLRLWFKPWEDADHDLYDQGYVYVQVDGGRWQIDHTPRAPREAALPLRPPPARTPAAETRPPPPAALPGTAPRAPRAEPATD